MPWSRFERAHREFEAVGFYLSEHPVEAYQDLLSRHQVRLYQDLQHLPLSGEEKSIVLAGVIAGKKERISKSGNKYAFVQFSDPTGLFEGVLFSEAFMTARPLLEVGTPVLIQASVKRDGDDLKIMIQHLRKLDESASAGDKTLTITVTDAQALQSLHAALTLAGAGSTQVLLQLRCPQFHSVIALKERYKITPKVLDALSVVNHIIETKVA